MTFNKFLSEGFSSFGPQEIYTNKEIELGLQYFEKIFPSFEDGIVDPNENDSHTDPRFRSGYKLENGVYFKGCALRHRFSRGRGSMIKSLDDNYLYGKRGICRIENIPKELFPLIENQNLLDVVEGYLKTSQIKLLQASISCVYPGNTGESRRYHTDTYGFLYGNQKFILFQLAKK